MLRLPSKTICTAAAAALALAACGIAFAAQDKYAVKVPGGMAFSEFRGFESWQTVAVSHSGAEIEVILGDPAMIAAYAAGIPGNGKPFPDGSRIAKIQWTYKKSTEAPFVVNVPDKYQDIFFIEKDSKRFPKTSGWGYARFVYAPASDSFSPDGKGSDCGYACHTKVAAKDYIFHPYQKR